MTSDMDFTVHHVDPAQEAVRPRPLSEKDQKKRKQQRSKPKKPTAGQASVGDEEKVAVDKKTKSDDDHVVDYYA